MSDTERGRDGTGLVVEEAAPKLKRPPLYQVVLINDDYTPMEFVVDILQRFFAMDRTKATRVRTGWGDFTGPPLSSEMAIRASSTAISAARARETNRGPLPCKRDSHSCVRESSMYGYWECVN